MSVQSRAFAIIGISIFILFLSAACKRGDTEPTATATSLVLPTNTLSPVKPTISPSAQLAVTMTEAAAYPAATQRPTRTPLGNYPAPANGGTQTSGDSGQNVGTAYPAPTEQVGTQTSDPDGYPAVVSATATLPIEAYPPPDGQQTATPTPAGGDLTPGTSPNITVTASPTFERATPTQTTRASGTPEISPTPSQTPTITLTPTLVRTGPKASDPEEFRVVSGQIQLVEFYATWSPSSLSMAPVLYFLEDRYGDQMLFSYLDFDDSRNELFAVLLENKKLPVIYLLNANGELLAEWEGIVSFETLEEAIVPAIGSTGN